MLSPFNQSFSQVKIHSQPFGSFVSCDENFKVVCIMSKFVACGFVNSILGHSINHSPEWILFGAFGVLWAAIKLGSCAYVQFYDLWFHEFNNQPFNPIILLSFWVFPEFCGLQFFNCDESSVNVHMSRFVVL